MESQSSNSSQGSQDSTLTITDENRREILYFAYGSNLSTEQMRQRCPYSTAVGLGKITGWRWIINQRGYANIVREEAAAMGTHEEDEGEEGAVEEAKGKGRTEDAAEAESQVYGMLYLLPAEDEERLDLYEGVPWAYEKAYLEADWVSSSTEGATRAGEGGGGRAFEELTPVKVLAYVDRKRIEEGRAKEEYVERMERGIEDAVRNWGMREEYADRTMRRLPAWFVRSGTSTGLLFSRASLPPVACQWQPILAPAMGSPDPVYGRQLDGMGSGISSTSKVVVVGPPSAFGSGSGSGSRVGPDVDAEFTFVQVGVRDGSLDLAGTCGNMSAIVGPAAWDMGILPPSRIPSIVSYDGATRSRWATVRILNTNTAKVVVSRFKLDGSPLAYCPHGDYAMDGVPGTQSPITLSFLDPAGAKTGRALPTGNPIDELTLADGSAVRASLVDVSNPGVFVTTSSLGLDDAAAAGLTPPAVEADAALKTRLEQIRQAGASAMGLDPKIQSVPKVVMLLPPSAGRTSQIDIQCLAMSMGQAHRAVPLTLSLCLGAASQLGGTIAAELMGGEKKDVVKIGHPSGVVDVGTTVRNGKIEEAKLLRTARVLMKGDVFY
ncbi:hypothetical protein Trco_007679 [Trichoderma cornu-damae]|uniref:Uncharacterized protein n=1 Tax=Trichoderma cornu-damae TaxID=654480 RepID=A0A9P8QJN4_9HYPO|nr:hypothetical protein Trco_007679 [Trichoderma cornu-damae]